MQKMNLRNDTENIRSGYFSFVNLLVHQVSSGHDHPVTFFQSKILTKILYKKDILFLSNVFYNL